MKNEGSFKLDLTILYIIVCNSTLFCLDHIENQHVVEYVIRVK